MVCRKCSTPALAVQVCACAACFWHFWGLPHPFSVPDYSYLAYPILGPAVLAQLVFGVVWKLQGILHSFWLLVYCPPIHPPTCAFYWIQICSPWLICTYTCLKLSAPIQLCLPSGICILPLGSCSYTPVLTFW
jgi:hypothetical protein